MTRTKIERIVAMREAFVERMRGKWSKAYTGETSDGSYFAAAWHYGFDAGVRFSKSKNKEPKQ